MVIRPLLPTDNLDRAAELLWLSDSYIMGDLFDNRGVSRAVGAVLFSPEAKDLFFYGRILVAEEKGDLQGILCWRDGPCFWDAQKLAVSFLQKGIELPRRFHRVTEQYFAKVAAGPLPSNSAECIFLAVSENYRNCGIGEALLRCWLSLPEYSRYYLDVLKANSVAVRLYKKCGFFVIEEHKAYPQAASHRCLRMKREIDVQKLGSANIAEYGALGGLER